MHSQACNASYTLESAWCTVCRYEQAWPTVTCVSAVSVGRTFLAGQHLFESMFLCVWDRKKTVGTLKTAAVKCHCVNPNYDTMYIPIDLAPVTHCSTKTRHCWLSFEHCLMNITPPPPKWEPCRCTASCWRQCSFRCCIWDIKTVWWLPCARALCLL